MSKTSTAGIVAGTFAATLGIGYVIANWSIFHKGDSGFGSCSTALEVCRETHGKNGLRKKTYIVTGANSGIGKETARALALCGAHVILPCRSMEKANQTVDEITKSCEEAGITEFQLTPALLDLNDLDSVREFCAFVKKMGIALDGIVCNAGIMALPKRTTTVQGIESQIGVCHVAHFLLVTTLVPELKAAENARVVCVSSLGHARAENSSWCTSPTLEGRDDYVPFEAYGYAKMSNILFAKEFNERFAKEGITAYSLHPGGIHTNLQGHVGLGLKLFWAVATPYFFKNIEQGAATSVYCLVSPQALSHTGDYFDNCNPCATKHDDWVNDRGLREAFWSNTEKLAALTGKHFYFSLSLSLSGLCSFLCLCLSPEQGNFFLICLPIHARIVVRQQTFKKGFFDITPSYKSPKIALFRICKEGTNA